MKRELIYRWSLIALGAMVFCLGLFATGIFEGEILAREMSNLTFIFLTVGFMKTLGVIKDKGG